MAPKVDFLLWHAWQTDWTELARLEQDVQDVVKELKNISRDEYTA